MARFYRIRQAVETDVPTIFKFIKELSAAIKNSGSVQTDEKELLQYGFGDHKMFHCLIIEEITATNTSPVGYGIFCFRFATWSGKQLYLDDIYVIPNHRNKGLGTLLMKEMCKIAAAEGCHQMTWHVMKWDNDAIRLYERWGGCRSGEHWLNFCLDQNTISKHAASEI